MRLWGFRNKPKQLHGYQRLAVTPSCIKLDCSSRCAAAGVAERAVGAIPDTGLASPQVIRKYCVLSCGRLYIALPGIAWRVLCPLQTAALFVEGRRSARREVSAKWLTPLVRVESILIGKNQMVRMSACLSHAMTV